MSLSYSPNALLQIKPNVFLAARIRNIRWKRDMTINVDTNNGNANDQVIPYDPNAVPEPVINKQNEILTRIKDRYNK